MLRYLTAGESHGPALTAILEGMPPGISIAQEDFDEILKKRNSGYGRGKRSQMEPEKVEVLSGIVNGKTIGSPIAIMIRNADYENHKAYMAPFNATNPESGEINIPLPGHADLAGMIKYGFKDCRYVRERASARETAIRTAISVPARNFLKEKGITSICMVESIGGIKANIDIDASKENLEKSIKENGYDYLTPDKNIISQWKSLIDNCKEKNTSLGGSGIIIFYGLPIGLGNYVEYDRRLDGIISQSIMSIPAIKGIEIGNAYTLALNRGNSADKILFDEEKGFYRSSNLAGGLEGGMTNGQPLIIRFYMKPLPANSKIESVDLRTKKAFCSEYYRSDTQAITAAAVVVESVVSIEIASALL